MRATAPPQLSDPIVHQPAPPTTQETLSTRSDPWCPAETVRVWRHQPPHSRDPRPFFAQPRQHRKQAVPHAPALLRDQGNRESEAGFRESSESARTSPDGATLPKAQPYAVLYFYR